MSKPLRVLHFQGRMGRGGAETFMMNTYRNLDRTKIQFDFLIYDEFKDVQPYHKEIESMGGRIFYVTNPKKNIFNYVKEVKKLLKRETFDIVHSQVFFGGGLNLWLANQAGIKKRIVHSHATAHEQGQSIVFKTIRKVLDQLMFKYATDYLACSYDAGRALFGNNHDFVFVPNGIDLEKYRSVPLSKAEIKAQLSIDDKTFVVGHIGRFEEQKNHALLVEIFQAILEKQPDSHLLLLGEGSLEESIKKKVASLGINEKVSFLGVREDIAELLKVFDVFLMPSLYEGLPISAVEAQAAGNKLVLADTISKETKLSENVTFVPLDKPKEYWAEKVLSEPLENEALKELEAYDMRHTARMMEDIYLNWRN